MQRKRSYRRVIAILLTVAVLYGWLCYTLASNYLRPDRRIPERPPYLSEVSVDSRFGPTPGWVSQGLANGKPSSVIFLLAHGYGGTRGSWDEPMQDLYQRGFDSLALAMPGQDASPVKSVSFGVNESHAIVDGFHWLRAKYPGHKIVVLGVSMGGAATWLATKEDPSIDGIVTDAAFCKFDESMNAFFERKIKGGSILFKPVIWIAEAISGIDPSSVRPIDAAPAWKGKPALVIQGDADTLVVPSHAQRLAAAAGCPLWMVPGAEHAQAYDTDRNGYLDHLVTFAKNLTPSKVATLPRAH